MQQERLVKRLKRAFTITELVIVIAVIAILAAVLIPTFMNVTKKAQQSADNQLVKNLNTILTSEAAIEGKNKTCYDAIQDAAEGGYQVDKITPTSDGDILWDSVNDCFVLYSEGTYQYVGVETPKTATADSAFSKIYNSKVQYESGTESASANTIIARAAEDGEFSAYLGEGALSEEKLKYYKETDRRGYPKNTLEITTGIDTGDYEIPLIEVDYSGNASNLVVRTSSASTAVTINSTSSTANVAHYGEAASVTVSIDKDKTFYESGALEGNVSVSSGSVEVAENAKAAAVLATGDEVKSVTVKNETTKVYTTVDNSNLKVNGATKEQTTLVDDYDEFKTALGDGGNITLGAKITVDKQKDPLAVDGKNVVLNLNGYKILGAITAKNNATLTIEGNGNIIEQAGAVVIESGATVTINGGTYNRISKKGQVSAASAFLLSGKGNLILNDCVAYARDSVVEISENGGGSTVKIDGGTYTSTDNAVIRTLGDTIGDGSEIKINGGTFNGSISSENYIACGVYVAWKDTVTINGGTFNITNGVGILMRSGTTTIGKNVIINLTNTGETISGQVGDSKVSVTAGAALVVDEVSNYPGGKPECKNNSSYKLYTLTDGTESN